MPHYVFIGGLHRSGTSLLADCLGQHPMVSAFANTGVPEDEGQHLQSVFPPAMAHGGPGRFAFDPAAHLTESSKLVQPELARQLFHQWNRHWDLSKPVLLEKSPPNLIRTRFLQAMVRLYSESPGQVATANRQHQDITCSFIVIVRNPLVVALATRKWCKDPVERLVEHWLTAHRIFEADRSHLQRVLSISYEDLVTDPPGTLARVWEFLGIHPVEPDIEIDSSSNARYLQQWKVECRGLSGRLRQWKIARMLRYPEHRETAAILQSSAVSP